MIFWYAILLIITCIIATKIINNFIFPAKVDCEECLRTFKTHPNKALTQCKYCKTDYILKADGTITKRKGSSLQEPLKKYKRFKKKPLS